MNETFFSVKKSKLLFLVLFDNQVNKGHAIGVKEFRSSVAGTLLHTGEVHVDNTHGTCVSREPVSCHLVGLDGILTVAVGERLSGDHGVGSTDHKKFPKHLGQQKRPAVIQTVSLVAFIK